MALRRGKGECVVLVTCAGAEEAERIARTLVERRLAACGNIVSAPVRSIYRWKGAVESAAEVLLILKTTQRALPKLEAAVNALHSYDVPECIALPIAAGSAPYLKWLGESASEGAAAKRASPRARRAAPSMKRSRR